MSVTFCFVTAAQIKMSTAEGNSEMGSLIIHVWSFVASVPHPISTAHASPQGIVVLKHCLWDSTAAVSALTWYWVLLLHTEGQQLHRASLNSCPHKQQRQETQMHFTKTNHFCYFTQTCHRGYETIVNTSLILIIYIYPFTMSSCPVRLVRSSSTVITTKTNPYKSLQG